MASREEILVLIAELALSEDTDKRADIGHYTASYTTAQYKLVDVELRKFIGLVGQPIVAGKNLVIHWVMMVKRNISPMYCCDSDTLPTAGASGYVSVDTTFIPVVTDRDCSWYMYESGPKWWAEEE